MTHQPIPCSVLVLTRNSAATLERCIRTMKPFGEILVHDANSTDNSVVIAKQYGARVEKQYDTDEPCVRIQDFTEMRMKQRADATYDWVLYVDSDEYMSDELVAELQELIPTLPPKTIVKFPRLSVIDGRVRTHGLYCPEIMPRIHHRQSGATLKKGKVVHEKYVYDDSFDVLVTKNPLYVPIPSVAELRSKDDNYIRMEAQRIKDVGYSWSQYVTWILLREPLVIASITFRILKRIHRYCDPHSVPFDHDWRYARYHWRLFWAITATMFRAERAKRPSS